MSSEQPPQSDSGAPRANRRRRLVAGAVALVVACVVVAVLLATRGNDTSSPRASATATTTTTVGASPDRVYRQILPSLVLVQSQRPGPATDGLLGTGVVIDQAGEIMTANHVVHDATSIDVTFADGTSSAATVQSTDVAHDIAVLVAQKPPSVIVPAVLGSDRGVHVGDEAYAAGNPFGLTASFSAGVISGLDRTVPLADGDGTLNGVIQFDAAVNPGNSGGPLLNRDGQVIGIVTGLANPTNQDVFVGIGFAVPISTAGGAARQPRQ